ncbi:MAG: hypothetical protein KGH94_01640 [Candidatus Micrarchaeota archaeon]|nr:hypothetical protein [Candidatus Micrarchaeota archaeon]
MIDDKARRIIQAGSIRLEVWRTGMLQFQVFKIKRVKIGQQEFVELYLNRLLDRSEIQRVANEVGLPVEAENGRAMPEGKAEKDFIVD